MADTTESIYLKVGIDTSGFNGSMQSMKQELIKLKGLVGNNLLSAEEQKVVLSRMAKLKDEIKDIGEATGKVKGLEVLARSIGGLAAGLGAVTGTMKLFGVESEALNTTMLVANTVMSAALGIQQLLELQNLKTAITTKVAAAAQWLWNAALTANPIGIVIVAVAALAAGLTALYFWQNKSTTATKEQTDAMKLYNDELNKTSDQTIANIIRRAEIEAEIADAAGDKQAKIDYQLLIQEQEHKKRLLELEKSHKAMIDQVYKDDDGENNEAKRQERLLSIQKVFNNAKMNEERRYNAEKTKIGFDAITKEAEEAKKAGEDAIAKTKEQYDKLVEATSNKYDNRIAREKALGKETFDIELEKYDALIKLGKQYNQDVSKLQTERFVLIAEQSKKEKEFQDALWKYIINQAIKNAKTAEEAKTIKQTTKKNVIADQIADLDKEAALVKQRISNQVLTEKQGSDWLAAIYDERNAKLREQADLKIEIIQDEITKLGSIDELRKKLTAGTITQEDYDKQIVMLEDYEQQVVKIKKDANAQMDEPNQAASEETAKRQAEAKKTLEQGAIAAAQKISDGVFNIISSGAQKGLEEALANLDKTYEYQYEKLDKMRAQNSISEEAYNIKKEKMDKEKAAKESALRKEKAQKDKAAAIIQATINTAIAVTAALTGGPILGEALAIVTAALGAIEIALIAAQPLAYGKGGIVKNYALGGMLTGPSHSQGGIPIFAEGGEMIINKKVTAKPGMKSYLEGINAGNNPTPSFDEAVLRAIVTEVVRGTTAIPVAVAETEMTRTQRKVNVMESRSSW